MDRPVQSEDLSQICWAVVVVQVNGMESEFVLCNVTVSRGL